MPLVITCITEVGDTHTEINVCCRRSEIKARQDAVEELLRGSCSELCQLQTTLKQLPDLEKGLCTIFHKKVD